MGISSGTDPLSYRNCKPEGVSKNEDDQSVHVNDGRQSVFL